jgi:hypothetical protein
VIRAVYVKTCADKFGIDEQILIDRVNKSRDEMLIAERKQAEREDPMPMPEDYMPLDAGDYGYDVPVQMEPVLPELKSQNGIVINDPLLEPCEQELLKFILEHGCEQLAFDRDSKYYMEGEPLNVAEFIDGILAEDEEGFANLSYRRVYDEYFAMYDEGLEQEQIQTRLLNSQDAQIAGVARELLIEKYQITVENYEKSMTATTTRLVQFVPKALMTYQCRKVEKILKKLTADLNAVTDDTQIVEIVQKITEYNKARTRLNNELGRVN